MGRIKNSRPLLMLHGFIGEPASFEGVCRNLTSVRRIWAPALYGHQGVCPTGGLPRFEEEIDRLAGWIRVRESEPVHLVGYSLGGRIGLGLMVRHPQLVQRATLVSTRRGLDCLGERRARQEQDARWVKILENEGISRFLQEWEGQGLFANWKNLPREIVDAERIRRQKHNPQGLALSLQAMGLAHMPSLANEVKRISIPVTFMVGGLDRKFCEIAEIMENEIKKSRRVVVMGAGHNLLLEHPERVAMEIEREG